LIVAVAIDILLKVHARNNWAVLLMIPIFISDMALHARMRRLLNLDETQSSQRMKVPSRQ